MPTDTLDVAELRSRIPTWPHIPRIFTRPSHLGFVIAAKPRFSSPGRFCREGSIPIARSTSGLAQVTCGYEIGVKILILWESVGNARRFGACLIS
jgi:hypothetical protein